MPLPPAPTNRAAARCPEASSLPHQHVRAASTAPRHPLTIDLPKPLRPSLPPAPTAAAPPKPGRAAAPRCSQRPATTALQPPGATASATPAHQPRRLPRHQPAAGASRSDSQCPRAAAHQRRQRAKPARRTGQGPPTRDQRARGPETLFVLDTNVLLHDPTSLFRFEEHDIFLPMIVLEELDAHKKGMTEVARNGRQVSRTLDALVAAQQGADTGHGPARWTPPASEAPRASLYFQTAPLDYKLPTSLPQGKADNQILGVVAGAARRSSTASAKWCWCPRTSTCASRRARWACLPRTTRTTRRWTTATCCTTGALAPARRLLEPKAKHVESWQERRTHLLPLQQPARRRRLMINQFVYFEAPGEPSLYARVSGNPRQNRGAGNPQGLRPAPRTPSGA